MGKFIVTFICIIIGVNFSGYSQGSAVYKYNRVTEFKYIEKWDDYQLVAELDAFGLISIGANRIIIKGYDGKPDKVFTILETQFEMDNDRDIYLCLLNGENCSVAISTDMMSITHIGRNDKYIYLLTR